MKKFIDYITESKIITLIERGGVGAFKWNNEIDEIIDYIKIYIKKNGPHNRSLVFEVPLRITKKISFIKNLKIIVNAELNIKPGFIAGGGGGEIYLYDKNVINFKSDNTISNCSIEINCYYDTHYNLKTESFTGSFYHEIDHAFKVWCEYKSKKNYDFFEKSILKGDISGNYTFFDYIRYRLFSEVEEEALISSVYGDLLGINSKRENFHNDIKITQAYKVYTDIKAIYKSEINKLTDEELNLLYKEYNNYGITRFKSLLNFKGDLENEIKIELNYLLYKIGKAASTYYDTHEEHKPTPMKYVPRMHTEPVWKELEKLHKLRNE